MSRRRCCQVAKCDTTAYRVTLNGAQNTPDGMSGLMMCMSSKPIQNACYYTAQPPCIGGGQIYLDFTVTETDVRASAKTGVPGASIGDLFGYWYASRPAGSTLFSSLNGIVLTRVGSDDFFTGSTLTVDTDVDNITNCTGENSSRSAICLDGVPDTIYGTLTNLSYRNSSKFSCLSWMVAASQQASFPLYRATVQNGGSGCGCSARWNEFTNTAAQSACGAFLDVTYEGRQYRAMDVVNKYTGVNDGFAPIGDTFNCSGFVADIGYAETQHFPAMGFSDDAYCNVTGTMRFTPEPIGPVATPFTYPSSVNVYLENFGWINIPASYLPANTVYNCGYGEAIYSYTIDAEMGYTVEVSLGLDRNMVNRWFGPIRGRVRVYQPYVYMNGAFGLQPWITDLSVISGQPLLQSASGSYIYFGQWMESVFDTNDPPAWLTDGAQYYGYNLWRPTKISI